MLDITLLPWWLPAGLLICGLVYTILTVIAIKTYKTNKDEIKELVNRSEECEAEVLNTIVLNDTNALARMRQASAVLSEFQNAANLPLEYVCTEIRFNIGYDIETVILRRAKMKIVRPGSRIKIYYDPYNPEQAFSKNMKSIILRKPFRDCIINGLVALITLLSAIFCFIQ